jgi:hypothetical protein
MIMSNVRRRAPDAVSRRSASPGRGTSEDLRGAAGTAQPGLITEPLRREAERAWAASDERADKRVERGRRKARARARRREAVEGKSAEIARLEENLEDTRRQLAPKRRGQGDPGRRP